jgi:hypothetical protein
LQRELEDAEDRAESVTKSILHSRRSSVSKWVQSFLVWFYWLELSRGQDIWNL